MLLHLWGTPAWQESCQHWLPEAISEQLPGTAAARQEERAPVGWGCACASARQVHHRTQGGIEMVAGPAWPLHRPRTAVEPRHAGMRYGTSGYRPSEHRTATSATRLLTCSASWLVLWASPPVPTAGPHAALHTHSSPSRACCCVCAGQRWTRQQRPGRLGHWRWLAGGPGLGPRALGGLERAAWAVGGCRQRGR